MGDVSIKNTQLLLVGKYAMLGLSIYGLPIDNLLRFP